MTIGFVGLGIMGAPMAANLLKAGHAVTGFDLSGERIEHLLARGGTGARSVAEAVADADLVITMLPDSPQVEEVVPEILEHARPGLLYLDLTSSPRERGGFPRSPVGVPVSSPVARQEGDFL